MGTIKVEWRHEGGEIKGRILEDAAGRRKIVFVGRYHQGRQPKHGEITEARVSKDTKPGEKHKGALLVMPVYPAEQGALSLEEATRHMRELIKKEGVCFDHRPVEVNLPGWRGMLHGTLPKSRDSGPIRMLWVFQDRETGNRTHIDSEDGLYHVMCKSIVRGSFGVSARVLNWPAALSEFGEPIKVEHRHGCAFVTWEDKLRYKLTAEVGRQEAIAVGFTMKDLRLDGHTVFATLLLLDGRWTEEEVALATGEQPPTLAHDWPSITRAKFEPAFQVGATNEQREEVAALLRGTIHSPDLHRQQVLHSVLAKTDESFGSIWREFEELEQAIDDPLQPSAVIKQRSEQVAKTISKIDHFKTVNIKYSHFVPEDALIYRFRDIDGWWLESEKYRKENESLEFKVRTEVNRLRRRATEALAKRDSPDFRLEIWTELQRLVEEHDKVFTKETSPYLFRKTVREYLVELSAEVEKGSALNLPTTLHNAREVRMCLQQALKDHAAKSTIVEKTERGLEG